MRMLPIAAVAAVLLGALPGACAEALAQEGGGGDRDRLGEVERKVGEAEDVGMPRERHTAEGIGRRAAPS